MQTWKLTLSMQRYFDTFLIEIFCNETFVLLNIDENTWLGQDWGQP